MKILFILWLFSQTILHFILLPLKLMIVFIAKMNWKPGFETYFDLRNHGEVRDKAIYLQGLMETQIQRLFDDPDGAKVMGLYVATVDKIRGKKAGKWLEHYFDKDGFKRTGSDLAFSRDMDAGFLYGLVEKSGDIDYHKWQILEKAVEKTIYQWPFLKHRGTGNRGFKFRYWFMGDHFIDTLTWLATYKHLFRGNKGVKWLFYYFLVVSYPLAQIAPETSVCRGKFMALGWYNAHSRALNCYLLYRLTGQKRWKKALFRITKKFWFNPEIVALYDLTKIVKKRNYYILEFVNSWLRDYWVDWEKIPGEWNKGYFNRENFINDGTRKTVYDDRIL